LQELQERDPRRIGPFRLVGRLGAGGMGRVYAGRSPAGRPVAVKVIREELAADPEFLARFAREVAAARSVSGMFTAAVVDADVSGQVPWLATAYVAGPSLAQAVREHGPLPVATVRALAAGLAEGLAAIHAAGLVHRDLKPSNVLLAEDGPRVIDFGISRAAQGTSLTHTGLVVGSPGFMSPEQAVGGEVGPPSDVFSLGAVLTFAAAGLEPFGEGSMAALVYRVVHAAPSLGPVPGELRPLVERCLAKDPGQRPTTAELLDSLAGTDLAGGWLPEAIVAGLPRHAPPIPPLDKGEPDQVPGTDDGGPVTMTVHRAPSPTPPAARRPGSATPTGTLAALPGRRVSRRAAVLALCGALSLVAAAIGALVLLNAPGRGQGGSGEAGASGAPASRALRTTSVSSGPATIVIGGSVGPTLLPGPGSEPPLPTYRLTSTLTDPGAGTLGVHAVAFSPDGKTLAAGDWNGVTYLWNVAADSQVGTLTDPDVGGAGIQSVAFSPNGKTLAIGDANGTTYLWDVATLTQVAALTNPAGGDQSVAFSPDGQTLASTGSTSTYLWNIATGTRVATLSCPASTGVPAVAFSPDGKELATGNLNGNVCLWRAPSGAPIAVLTSPGPTGIQSVAFSHDGTLVAAGGVTGTTYLWNVATQARLTTMTDPGGRVAWSLAFSPDDRLLAVGDINDSTYLWDLSGTRVATLTDPQGKNVQAVAFSPDGNTLAAGDASGTTYLWRNAA
jgi:WD40 repeat protein